MARAIDLALKHHVAPGAHPGYPDRDGFGRRPLDINQKDLRASIREQIERLRHLARLQSTALGHVKPHGALYNEAARDARLAATVAGAVRSTNPRLRLIGLAGSLLTAAGRSAKLKTAEEGFADRRYRADGTLAPRDQPDALITDPAAAAAQALILARGAPLETIDAQIVRIHAATICVHADTPGALENARAVRAALEGAGFTVAAL
jgi:UPF0271 protein